MIEELINQLAEDEGTVKNDNDRHIVYKFILFFLFF